VKGRQRKNLREERRKEKKRGNIKDAARKEDKNKQKYGLNFKCVYCKNLDISASFFRVSASYTEEERNIISYIVFSNESRLTIT
jgi:ribosomal protein L44E